jgi:hypothetical protein
MALFCIRRRKCEKSSHHRIRLALGFDMGQKSRTGDSWLESCGRLSAFWLHGPLIAWQRHSCVCLALGFDAGQNHSRATVFDREDVPKIGFCRMAAPPLRPPRSGLRRRPKITHGGLFLNKRTYEKWVSSRGSAAGACVSLWASTPAKNLTHRGLFLTEKT